MKESFLNRQENIKKKFTLDQLNPKPNFDFHVKYFNLLYFTHSQIGVLYFVFLKLYGSKKCVKKDTLCINNFQLLIISLLNYEPHIS